MYEAYDKGIKKAKKNLRKEKSGSKLNELAPLCLNFDGVWHLWGNPSAFMWLWQTCVSELASFGSIFPPWPLVWMTSWHLITFRSGNLPFGLIHQPLMINKGSVFQKKHIWSCKEINKYFLTWKKVIKRYWKNLPIQNNTKR